MSSRRATVLLEVGLDNSWGTCRPNGLSAGKQARQALFTVAAIITVFLDCSVRGTNTQHRISQPSPTVVGIVGAVVSSSTESALVPLTLLSRLSFSLSAAVLSHTVLSVTCPCALVCSGQTGEACLGQRFTAQPAPVRCTIPSVQRAPRHPSEPTARCSNGTDHTQRDQRFSPFRATKTRLVAGDIPETRLYV